MTDGLAHCLTSKMISGIQKQTSHCAGSLMQSGKHRPPSSTTNTRRSHEDAVSGMILLVRCSDVLTVICLACLGVRFLQDEHLADDVEQTRLLWVVVVNKVHQVVVVEDVLDDALRPRAIVVQLPPLLSPQLKRLVLESQTVQYIVRLLSKIFDTQQTF